MSSSSPDPATSHAFLPGNARVLMGAGMAGPSEMTINEIEGNKLPILDESTELAFWARVRAKAQAKACEILNQAMVEAEALRQQARQEGLAQGLAEAQQTVQAEMATVGATLAATLAGLEESRPALWAGHRQEFAVLLKLCVEKTLHTELRERHMEILDNLLDQAIELLDTRPGFTVFVHPEDEASVAPLLEEARKGHPGLGAWRIKTDPALTPGGVRLESEAGMVDNTLDTRFQQIAELLERVTFGEAEP
jgi:flagellar assembly protein FliH